MKPSKKLRPRLLLGALLLLGLGLLWQWRVGPRVAAAPAQSDAAAVAEAPAPAPGAATAAASEATVSGAAPSEAAVSEAAVSAPVDDGPPGVPQENDPIEPELPQTPEWRLEKTAHLSTLMDRHVARLEAERVAAQAAGRPEEAKRLEVATARAQRRLASLRAEMDALRARVAAGGDTAQ